jgi:DNA polymerase-3 subunit epsilon
MLDADFAVVDLETTGFASEGSDRIVEIAIIRCRPNAGIVDRYVTLVDPGRGVGATPVHGLRPGDVRDAPVFSAIADDVLRRLEGAVLTAHNARFDIAFLQAELARAGRPALREQTLCTIGLAARLGVKTAGRSLGGCCATFDVPYDSYAPHGAERDARAAARVLLCLLREARTQGVASLRDLGCMRAEPVRMGIAAPHHATRSDRDVPVSAKQRVAAAARQLGADSPIGDPEITAYLELLDRVLADRVLTADEAGALNAAARRGRLSERVVARAHADYVERLAELAWADGVTTDAETADLRVVAELLGVKKETAWKC